MKIKAFKTTMLILTLWGGISACSEYDDGGLWDKVNELDDRISVIEADISQKNTDIKNLSIVVNALQTNMYVTDVTILKAGYTITFSNGQTITIKAGQDGLTPYIGSNGNWWIGSTDTGVSAEGSNGTDGKDGADGEDGQDGKDGLTPYIGANGNWWIGYTDTGISAAGVDGKDGQNGKDGQDGSAPMVSIDVYEGRYYWVLIVNGKREWIYDSNGDMIPASSSAAKLPRLKVGENGYWMISYDNGVNYWEVLDEYGVPVKAVGNDGTSGNGDGFFKSVTVEGNELVLVLLDGTVIRIPFGNTDGESSEERFNTVVPEEIQEKIDDWMPIYLGINPPNIEGCYLMSPATTVYCEDENNGGYEKGDIVSDIYLRFSNQDMTNNLIDLENSNVSGSSYGIGKGAFISGEGNHFTAFFNTVGSTYGISTKTALVISGTYTQQGISDLYYAFIMVDKGDDPEGQLMQEGIFRIFNDGDKLSTYTAWPSAVTCRGYRPAPQHDIKKLY